MRRLLQWFFWLSVFALSVTVESWSSGVPMTVAILSYIGVMTYIAVRWS